MSNSWRYFLTIITPAIIFIFSPSVSLAASQFTSDYDINYIFLRDGQANITEKITVTNQTLDYYLSRFELSLGVTDIADLTVSDESNEKIQTALKIEDKTSRIELLLNEKTVGLGKEKIINLSYSTKSLASQKGLMWEVTIPKLEESNDVQSYNVTVQVPRVFGSPNDVPDKEDTNFFYYYLSRDQLTKKGYQYSFGDYQLYDFEIIYVLKNPNLFAADLDITLPPYINGIQEVYFENLTPQPAQFIKDADGNQIARFNVAGGKTLNPKVTGMIRVFSGINDNENLLPAPTAQDVSPQPFWESDNPSIAALADRLKTAQSIYNYVVENIDYSQEAAIALKGRLGALAALNQKKGVCTEYSDLFVALSRAAGIPSQALEGFAYTPESAKNSATSILHSWARYWDKTKGWQYVDPTWGHTTSGIDYFQKFDTNHIIFAVKGLSSTTPYPAGSYLEGETTLRDELAVTPSKDDKCFKTGSACSYLFTFETLKKDLAVSQTAKVTSSKTVFLALALLAMILISAFALILLRR